MNQLKLRKQLKSVLIKKHAKYHLKVYTSRQTLQEISEAYEKSKLLNDTLRASSLNAVDINLNYAGDSQMSVYGLEKQFAREQSEAIN